MILQRYRDPFTKLIVCKYFHYLQSAGYRSVETIDEQIVVKIVQLLAETLV